MSEVLAEKSDAGNQFAIKSIFPACCSFGFRFSMGVVVAAVLSGAI
jgi:hypothetical protein